MSSSTRVVLLGSTSVGKTTLINRMIQDKFDEQVQPTTGATYCSYNQRDREIQIWDTAGMERFRSVNKVYYRDAVGAILVFDLTSYESFTNLDSWLSEFMENTNTQNPIILLVGNKLDLTDEIEVTPAQVTQFCEDHNMMKYFQVSAKTGQGVVKMFQFLLSILPEPEKEVVETVNVFRPTEVEQQSSCC